MSPWYEYASSGPIAVEGGIKAKSKRGAIGEQWWSRRFIAVLESYGMSGRLQRGRSYARRGQVLEFSLSTGKVTARVQGSRPPPYKVSITVLPLTSAQWREVESRLAEPGAVPRPAAGRRDAGRDRGGLRLLRDAAVPALGRRPDMSCSCPDWGVPCKHLAAVCYVLAEAFDDDPFAMLAWRGKGRDDLLAALRGSDRRAAGAGGAAASGGRRDQPGPGATVRRDRGAASGNARRLLVTWPEPGAPSCLATQPRDTARPAAQDLGPAAASGQGHRTP